MLTGVNMKETRRISFDVPVDIHTTLKISCAKQHIALRDMMRENAIKLAEEQRKNEFHEMLLKGFQESYEGKGRVITQEELDEWDRIASSND